MDDAARTSTGGRTADRLAVPVSAPERVRDRLRTAADGPVRIVHRGQHAVYVDLGGWCVGAVSATGVRLPNSVRTRLRDIASLSAATAYLATGVLHIGSRPLLVGRTVDVRAPRVDRGVISRNTAGSATGMATPPASVVGLVAHLHGLEDAETVAGSVGRLLGRGPGLTPLGDDLLCGWLATHRAAGAPTPEVDHAVRSLSHRTTLLSATLLDCALHGEVLPELAAYLTALGTPAEADRAARLCRIGDTSGSGLLAGARVALDQPAAGRAAA